MDGSSFSRRTRALIADDHEINRFVLARLLELYGVRVTEAANGAEAVRLAGEEAFDLILLETNLSRVDGPDAARLIRGADCPSRHALLVAVSPFISPHDRPALAEAGFDRFLEKPLRQEAIQALVEAAPQRSRTSV